MLEIPEAAVMARQLNKTISQKNIRYVIAAHNPHGFAWYSCDPASYSDMLLGKTVGTAVNLGGMLNIQVEDVSLLFADGVNLRFHPDPAEQPSKHQLLIEFEDATSLSASVAMYGGLWCFPEGSNDNPYYLGARDKPSPLSNGFNEDYFFGLFQPELENLLLKAFLATQQRIPGLGNGVLQDILYQARLHPKRNVASLGQEARCELFQAVKTTLREMTDHGGRDTEKDLYGNMGGYLTQVSKNTVGKTCPCCGATLQKQAYMGGSIYFCPGCQKEN